MRSTEFTFLAAITSSVAAQTTTPISFSNFPACAIAPALQAVGATGCGTNLPCVCGSITFIPDAYQAVEAACSPSDLQRAVQAAKQLCSEYGYTITIPNGESSTTTTVPVTPPPVASTALETSTSSTFLSDSSSTTTVSTEEITSTSPSISASAIPSIAPNTTLTKGASRTSTTPSAITVNGASAQGTWANTDLLGFGVLLAVLLWVKDVDWIGLLVPNGEVGV